MKRNKVTTIDQLAMGDRFYFLADSTKAVWQKVDRKAKTTPYRTYRYWAMPVPAIENKSIRPAYYNNHIKAVDKANCIVYLRSTGQLIETNE